MSGMVITDIEDAFRTWLRTVLPSPWNGDTRVIFGNQNAPKPGVDMIEIRRGNPYVMKVGRDVQLAVDEDALAARRVGTRELNLSLRAYGRGALQVLEDVRARLDDEMAIDALIASDILVIDSGDALQNLTVLYGSQYKEVGNLELRIRTSSLREGADAEAGVGYIQAVDLEVRTKNPGAADTVENLQVGEPAS